jgi:hypothetical protein
MWLCAAEHATDGIDALVAGVQSVGIEGEERDQLVVVGDGVDATSLTSCLRKTVKVGRADIIKVEEVVEEKKAAAAAATGCSNPVAACPPQWYPYHPGYGYYCPRTGVVYPYAAGGHCYVEDSDEGSWCAIM